MRNGAFARPALIGAAIALALGGIPAGAFANPPSQCGNQPCPPQGQPLPRSDRGPQHREDRQAGPQHQGELRQGQERQGEQRQGNQRPTDQRQGQERRIEAQRSNTYRNEEHRRAQQQAQETRDQRWLARHSRDRSWQDQRYHPDRPAPRIGERAYGTRLTWHRGDRWLPPPRPHTHYEWLNGRVVLVSNNTLEVVAVIGLLSALLSANN